MVVWLTREMDPLSESSLRVLTSCPSRDTLPSRGSWNLSRSLTRVVLPDPVAPTNPTVFPAGTSRPMPLRTSSLPGYVNRMSSNLMSPSTSSMLVSPSTTPTSVSSRSSTLVVDARALWYRSNVSPSLVSGQSSLCVMNTITEYSPRPILPSRAYFPPTRRLAVNAKRMAILISGTKDAESLIADLLASR